MLMCCVASHPESQSGMWIYYQLRQFKATYHRHVLKGYEDCIFDAVTTHAKGKATVSVNGEVTYSAAYSAIGGKIHGRA